MPHIAPTVASFGSAETMEPISAGMPGSRLTALSGRSARTERTME